MTITANNGGLRVHITTTADTAEYIGQTDYDDGGRRASSMQIKKGMKKRRISAVEAVS